MMVSARAMVERHAQVLVALEDALGDRDPLVRLGVVAELKRELLVAEVAAIEEARRRGHTWEAVARASGLASRQAAYGHWRRATAKREPGERAH